MIGRTQHVLESSKTTETENADGDIFTDVSTTDKGAYEHAQHLNDSSYQD